MYNTLPYAYPRPVKRWMSKRKIKKFLRCRFALLPSDDAMYYVRPR